MQIKIENQKLEQCANLLRGLSLKGTQSRHRTKFIKKLEEKNQEFVQDEMSLIMEHCHLDEFGQPKTIENGTKWDLKDPYAFVRDRQELYTEEVVFDGGENSMLLLTLKDALLNCDTEWSGEDAEIYDYLCDQLEGQEG